MKKRRLKIIIAGEVFSDNIGDQLISLGIGQLLEHDFEVIPFYFSKPSIGQLTKCSLSSKQLPKSQHTKTANTHCTSYQALSWIRHHLLTLYKGLHRQSPQYVFIGGGQLILSNQNFPIALFSWALCCRALSIPFGLIGVGAGQNYTWFEKLLIGFVLRSAHFIYVRDRQSIKTLKTKFGASSSFIPDLAYAYRSTGTRAPKRIYKTAWVGVTDYNVYRRYAKENGGGLNSHDAYLEYWKNLVADYIMQGYHVTLAWTTDADYRETCNLYDILPSHQKVTLIKQRLAPDAFIDNLRTVDEICAGRMHFLIMGQIAGCFVKPFFISQKIKDYWNEYEGETIETIDKKLHSARQQILHLTQTNYEGDT